MSDRPESVKPIAAVDYVMVENAKLVACRTVILLGTYVPTDIPFLGLL
jgi:hypothetical protein